MKFLATIHSSGKSATGIVVPEDVVAALGSGKRPAIRVTLNGFTYRTTIGVMGGEFLIPVSGETRKLANVAGGDTLEVDVELDLEPRVVVVPSDFAEALTKDPEAEKRFQKLSYSHQLRHVLAIDSAKTPETRGRRIEKAIEMLLEV